MVGSRNRRALNMVALMALVISKLLCAECRHPVLHRVGGRYSWNPETNFTEWSIHEHFYVGDWLYFGFDKKTHSVLEVNKAGYEECIVRDFISNATRGGRDVFNLTEAKTYYFIDGRGYCMEGMKVSVPVEEYLPPPSQSHSLQPYPPLQPSHNSALPSHVFSCVIPSAAAAVAFFML